jgi:hypothetical protein
MNGVHDMGGMTCFGPIVHEENEPVFHALWERRVFALTMLAMGNVDTLDAFRHVIERMDTVVVNNPNRSTPPRESRLVDGARQPRALAQVLPLE